MTQDYQFPTEEELKQLKLNWKRYILPPIHPEGVKILAVEAVIVALLAWLWLGFLWLGVPVLVF